MDATEFQDWVHRFYQERGWSQYGPFIRVGFLMEEVGEVARVVRSLEIGRDRPDESKQPYDELRRDLTKELGDVLANLLILAKKYDIEFDDILRTHTEKLAQRFD